VYTAEKLGDVFEIFDGLVRLSTWRAVALIGLLLVLMLNAVIVHPDPASFGLLVTVVIDGVAIAPVSNMFPCPSLVLGLPDTVNVRPAMSPTVAITHELLF
jgi:hypothetical protein